LGGSYGPTELNRGFKKKVGPIPGGRVKKVGGRSSGGRERRGYLKTGLEKGLGEWDTTTAHGPNSKTNSVKGRKQHRPFKKKKKRKLTSPLSVSRQTFPKIQRHQGPYRTGKKPRGGQTRLEPWFRARRLGRTPFSGGGGEGGSQAHYVAAIG